MKRATVGSLASWSVSSLLVLHGHSIYRQPSKCFVSREAIFLIASSLRFRFHGSRKRSSCGRSSAGLLGELINSFMTQPGLQLNKLRKSFIDFFVADFRSWPEVEVEVSSYMPVPLAVIKRSITRNLLEQRNQFSVQFLFVFLSQSSEFTSDEEGTAKKYESLLREHQPSGITVPHRFPFTSWFVCSPAISPIVSIHWAAAVDFTIAEARKRS